MANISRKTRHTTSHADSANACSVRYSKQYTLGDINKYIQSILNADAFKLFCLPSIVIFNRGGIPTF